MTIKEPFFIGDQVQVHFGTYIGCVGKVVKVTKLQLRICVLSGSLAEPGDYKRIAQSSARILSRYENNFLRGCTIPERGDEGSFWSQSISCRRMLREDVTSMRDDFDNLLKSLERLEIIENKRFQAVSAIRCFQEDTPTVSPSIRSNVMPTSSSTRRGRQHRD